MKITFAGIDETCPVEFIKEMQFIYPNIEFAILLSEENAGKKWRYPSVNYINTLLESKFYPHFTYAIHLCGSICDKLWQHRNYCPYLDIIKKAKRVQVNKKSVITQRECYNIVATFKNVSYIQPVSTFEERLNDKVDLLWDKSGGKGKFLELSEWPEPIPNQLCAYAGGISPENIKDIKNWLTHWPSASVALDMESGIRTDNKIDTIKIREICKEIYGY